MSLHYLLDGYNIIKRTAALADLTLEAGRNRFLALLQQHQPQGSQRNRITVVFDGKPDMWGAGSVGDITVIFTEYTDADAKLKEIVEDAPRRDNCVIVTDDKALGLYIRSLGAQWEHCATFMARMKSTGQGAIKGKTSSEKTMPYRLEYEVNEELKRLWLKDEQ